MTKENNKVDINKHEVDIDTLKKQNVNDLLSIKEIYSKLEELGEKITKIKYIDNTLVKKIKKEYGNLKKIILDENIQIKLTNDIKTINSQLDNNTKLGYANTSIFTMKHRFESDHVNIKDFGAKGDGKTDDSSAFQEAFDYINNNGLKLLIPKGNYLINNPIILKDNGTYFVEGRNANINCYIKEKNNCIITCKSENLFEGELTTKLTGCQIIMSNLHFYKVSGTKNSCLFKNIKLTSSRIYNNSVLGFGSIIKGKIETVTKIYDNFIEGIRDGFLTVSEFDDGSNLVDSEIYNNYLNGMADSNITMFQLTFSAYSIIHDNFIDFCKYVFNSKVDKLWNLRIYNNTFDYCFRFVQENKFIRYSHFLNNKFSKFSKAYISSFPNADDDMKNKEWGVFMTTLFKYCTLESSHVESCDNYFKCNNNSICKVKITKTIYNPDNTPRCYYEVNASSDKNDTFIDELEYQVYESFPTSPSGKSLFYNNQLIIYNNKILRFYNNKFYDMSGNVVTS